MAYIRRVERKDGDISYQVEICLRGSQPVTKRFRNMRAAERWGREVERDIRSGRYFKEAESKRHTFTEAAERFIKDEIPKLGERTQKTSKSRVKWWSGKLGAFVLADIEPAAINEILGEMRHQAPRGVKNVRHQKNGGVSETTIRAYAIQLQAVLSACIEWGWMEPGTNPVTRVKLPAPAPGRVRWLDEKELTALLAAAGESDNRFLRPAILLSLSTGARAGELLALTWGNVDLTRGTVFFPDTKNKTPRTVPLTPPAAGALRELMGLRRLGTDLVFPGGTGKPVILRKSFLTALKRAGITGFTWHDLRHSCASFLVMSGVSLRVVQEILGHKNITITGRYSHLSTESTRAALDSVFGSGRLGDILAGNGGSK